MPAYYLDSAGQLIEQDDGTLPHPPPLKVLPGERAVWVYSLTFGRARLVVGRIGSAGYDDGY